MKVVAIEEAQDVSSMKVDELIGSLQTFELKSNNSSERKAKSIALVANSDSESIVDEDGQSLTEALALLAKRFGKPYRKFDRNVKPNVQNIGYNRSSDFSKNHSENSNSSSNQQKNKKEEKGELNRGIQCHECEGYGHIRSECATFLKRQKSFVTSWTDEDSEEDEEVSANLVKALVSSFYDSDSSQEEMTIEEIEENYKLLFVKWKELGNLALKQEAEIVKLKAEIKNLKNCNLQLEDDLLSLKEEVKTAVDDELLLQTANMDLVQEVSFLKNKLEETLKSLRMLNNGSEMLDQILTETSKQGNSLKGIGFNDNSAKEQIQKKFLKFVPETQGETSKSGKCQMSHTMSHHRDRHSKSQLRNSRFKSWKCHFCGKNGHIKPYCYKLHGYSQIQNSRKMSKGNSMKKIWKVKSEDRVKKNVSPEGEDSGVTPLVSIIASSLKNHRNILEEASFSVPQKSTEKEMVVKPSGMDVKKSKEKKKMSAVSSVSSDSDAEINVQDIRASDKQKSLVQVVPRRVPIYFNWAKLSSMRKNIL